MNTNTSNITDLKNENTVLKAALAAIVKETKNKMRQSVIVEVAEKALIFKS
jgi:hypothetical protein